MKVQAYLPDYLFESLDPSLVEFVMLYEDEGWHFAIYYKDNGRRRGRIDVPLGNRTQY
jgi:hypothetical protein